MNKHAESLFLQGNFKKIVADFEVNSKSQPDPYSIGALVFTGKTEEAEVYFEKWQSKYSNDEKVLILFFLSVGFIRSSNFKKSRFYLGQAFSYRHQLKEKSSKVFLFQVFGFYAYFICRYKKATYWAQKAWRFSLLFDSDFGQIISCDLLAHALIETGEIEKGFVQLENASKVATRFGQGALVTSLEVAKLCYKAALGLKTKNILGLLQKKYIQIGTTKDTYSKTNLGLEIVRQFILKGEVNKAFQTLKEIQPEVFKFGHRRQKSTWYFRLAYMEHIKGEDAAAIGFLKSAYKEIDETSDLSHKLQILGLQLQIQTPYLEPDEKTIRQNEISELSYRVGSALALKYLQRSLNKIELTEDSLGTLIDQTKIQNQSTLETTLKITELGYYQLLRQYLVQPKKRHLFMEVLPGALLVFSNGEVELFHKSITPLLQRTLLLLKKGPQSKKEFIEGLWGYQYDPLRHDQLVHATLTRLRKSLGKYSEWIRNENDLITLESDIGVGVFEHSQIVPAHAPILENQNETSLRLNYRQIKILSELRKSETLSIRDCMIFFKATKITVNRDLKLLLRQNLITQSGQGKSTRYHLR